jgi:D-3-phosphoglycerate dehydrogenase
MYSILANDGIHPKGKQLLEEAGFEVITNKIAQEDLASQIAEFDVLIVRSATKVREADLQKPGKLRLIGRAGVGLDNIDLDYANQKDITVFNTPGASSKAVASLAIAHLLAISRNLHQAARAMPVEGATNFANLKKKFAGGFELENKTIGIIGFGRIGQELAQMAIGLGMKIFAYDSLYQPTKVNCKFAGKDIEVPLEQVSLEELYKTADVISLHIPSQGGKAVIAKAELEMMKDGVILINTSRGGLIDEADLLEALDNGKVAAVGLDVFNNEPTPNADLLAHPNVSATPHIGAETEEAQERIGIELAENIIQFFK